MNDRITIRLSEDLQEAIEREKAQHEPYDIPDAQIVKTALRQQLDV